MTRLTTMLDDDRYRALKETAARQGRSIASIIEESLRLRGIQDRESACVLVAQARCLVSGLVETLLHNLGTFAAFFRQAHTAQLPGAGAEAGDECEHSEQEDNTWTWHVMPP